MTTPLKLIQADVRDEQDWRYKNALVAFYQIAEYGQKNYIATDENPVYSVTQEIDSIGYNANFWMNPETKSKGKNSRPIYLLGPDDKPELDESGEKITTFMVDISKQQYQQILNSVSDPVDAILQVIELHYKTEIAGVEAMQ